MNHVFGNGQHGPTGGANMGRYKLEKTKLKNELKGIPYITCKHMIENATVKTFDTCANFVKLYLEIRSENCIDQSVIKSQLTKKFHALFPDSGVNQLFTDR